MVLPRYARIALLRSTERGSESGCTPYGGLMSPIGDRLLQAYRATGADLPFGDPLAAHGVDMEGYFWRLTDLGMPDRPHQRSLIALIGINRANDADDSHWATVGFGAHPSPVLVVDALDTAEASTTGLAVRASGSSTNALGGHGTFRATDRELHVDLGPGARVDLTISNARQWPRQRFGGSSWFQSVPALNQYWHPWLLGGRASGTAQVGDETWTFEGAQIYGEKNWGRAGFPDSWWWGQAHGFAEPDACIAFAGGQVSAGPLHTEVTALVVALPGGEVIRLGNPVTSPVHAEVTDEEWVLRGQSRRYAVRLRAHAPLAAAHVLPVPLPRERRNTAGAIEHLGGHVQVEVRERHGGRLVWHGVSEIAGLEHGGLARAEAELRRRGVPDGAVAGPAVG